VSTLLWKAIVSAHERGDIDLAEQTVSEVASEFGCSGHTVSRARKYVGLDNIRVRQHRHPFHDSDKWNDGRRELLEGWAR